MSADLELRSSLEGEATVLVTLQPDRDYHALWNGQPVFTRAAPSGTLQIALPRDSGRGRLQVEAVPA